MIFSNRHKISKGKKQAGFSIAEMLVVLIIISFASTVALLSYSKYRHQASVRGAAEKIRSLLVETRTRAIADNLPAQVVFDLDNEAIWIDTLELDGTTVREPKVVAPEFLGPDVVIESVSVGGGDPSDSDLVSAVFEGDGANPLITVALRRESDDPSIDENFFTVQMFPTSTVPRVLPNERR